MTARRDREDGSAALYVVWCAVALLAVAAALGAVGVARVARARAASAADLSALAGAAAHGRGEDACGAASRTAARGASRLVECSASPDGVVSVVVALPMRGPMATFGSVLARARAGPGAPASLAR